MIICQDNIINDIIKTLANLMIKVIFPPLSIMDTLGSA